MRILGIDPSLTRTGWGVIEVSGRRMSFLACGSVAPKSKLALSTRLGILGSEIRRVCETWEPDAGACEAVVQGRHRNVKSALLLAHARGAVMSAAALFGGLAVTEYSAASVKAVVAGTGGASKELVATFVQHSLDGRVMAAHDDETDALAVAICHALHGPGSAYRGAIVNGKSGRG